jgi:hypothetical protein
VTYVKLAGVGLPGQNFAQRFAKPWSGETQVRRETKKLCDFFVFFISLFKKNRFLQIGTVSQRRSVTAQPLGGRFNPNHHCLKTVIIPTACGIKRATITPPPLQSNGGGGGCFLRSHEEAHWKLHIYWKPLKQKSLFRNFSTHSWFFNKHFARHPRIYFRPY